MKCEICDLEMSWQSKPYWVIDTDSEKVIARAHAGCARAKVKTGTRFMLLRVLLRVGDLGDVLSERQVVFTSRAFRIRAKLQSEKTKESLHCSILLCESFGRVESLADLLQTKRTRELLDWWENGSKILTREQIEKVISRLKQEFQKLEA